MSLLDSLRGGLIVSVQAWRNSAIDDPSFIAAMARSSQDGGAVAVRVQGEANLRAVRNRVALPMIGLIKREYSGFEPYITPTLAEVGTVIGAGAEIVAFDATARARPDGSNLEDAIAAAHAAGRLAMADCATAREALAARDAGADILATTLCGYTKETTGYGLPALDLVGKIASLGCFTVCEGGVRTPQELRAALDAGADAVVVGSAITNVDWLVREFAGAADGGS
ncbi:MAG TPA: N-acetylmannosamine-6-phosphate 2-epimerase [Candidatus Cybelea sp.]|jgi:N-acylglucosamine-6-phosphate 2-epimerase|nr:N-acetylmannosamine-6-phosphate 2-epimerase [Candidatus Cybelea sp.]